MPERITAVKKSSLADLSEGWGDECYAIVRPAKYEDMLALDAVKAETPAAQVAYQHKVVADHFITGKIKVWTANGEQELVDMTSDDVDCSVAVLDKLFADIIGFDVDPKDLRVAAAHGRMLPPKEKSTATPSSTDAPRDSPEPSPGS